MLERKNFRFREIVEINPRLTPLVTITNGHLRLSIRRLRKDLGLYQEINGNSR